MPDERIPDQDPVVTKSYVPHFLIATVLLVATLFWALWDENYGQRPWKKYQEEFRLRYSRFLTNARSQSAKSQEETEQSPEYQKLEDAYRQANEAAEPRAKQIRDKLHIISANLLAVQSVFTDKRAYTNAIIYQIETSTSESAKKNKQQELEQFKARQTSVAMPDGSVKRLNYDQLEKLYNDLRQEKTDASLELGEVLKPVTEAQEKRDQYISDHMVNLTPEQIAGLQKKLNTLEPEVRQIVVPDPRNSGNPIIVDRCESCHMGTREPLKLTAASMALPAHKPDKYAYAFTSHPDPDLLKIHDPEKFGCTPCHQGNGRATTSMVKAHGNYEHWLWPLFPQQNAEAGCQTCHSADMVLISGDVGHVISDGKFLFEQRGCMGCHRYEGYNKEPEELLSIDQQIKLLEEQQKDNLKQSALLMKRADQTETNEEANKLNDEAVGLKVANSQITGQIQQLDHRTKSVLRDMKKVGPNLKEIREKLNKNWIPVWLHKPTDFRPTTKMPNFRLTDEQIKDITAYLWQSALTDPIPKAQPGNAAHGKELFETRGCLACHSIGEGNQRQGGDFAANLTRVGEKDNYDYLVRWVHNPRQRTRPYCPYEKKDIGPEDYAKHGLPYVFDYEHTKCPNDGHELQVQQMTVMPSLRLSQEDAQDIASYLITLKEKDPSSYPPAPFMDDPARKAKGLEYIKHFGCAGCHEIAGLEDEGRIGTELTSEGSKPIERLDFALFTHTAETGGKDPITGKKTGPWYDHKGFFEHKLEKPNVFDEGKVKSENDKLRMPDPHLTRDQVRSLTTFLLGSQDFSLPASYQYKPEDARRDIQEGWWIVRKYNCMGCHQFMSGQTTALMQMKRYQDPDWKEQLPPKLLLEGARVDPEWLMRFLSNPALSTTDTNRNGVRPYLKVRMPTFFFSDNELRKLVRFFQALSQQPMPYVPDRVPVLTAKETEMARSLFSSEAAPCLKCHATGDPVHDRTATAPNFLLARERLKPQWTEQWIIDPQSISPGTSMPSNLFRKDHGRWVFNGPTPPSFQGYDQDQTKLLVRYIFQLTPEEQKRVSSALPRAGGPKTSRKAAGTGASGR